MKTFFSALFLGIFIGALATTYFKSPEAFDDLLPNSKQSPDIQEENKSQLDELSEKTKEKFAEGKEMVSEIAEDVKEKTEEFAIVAKEKGTEWAESGRDLTIAIAIRGKFKLDKNIDSEAIEIEVMDSRVTLTGTVDSLQMKQLAIDTAMNTKGVKEVAPNLDVKSN